ncbi:MAG: hypothetical protein JNJ78_11150 [Anaerolineae bacterium]|nr:hypothetical protein [Anaerolineae bacterium]
MSWVPATGVLRQQNPFLFPAAVGFVGGVVVVADKECGGNERGWRRQTQNPTR